MIIEGWYDHLCYWFFAPSSDIKSKYFHIPKYTYFSVCMNDYNPLVKLNRLFHEWDSISFPSHLFRFRLIAQWIVPRDLPTWWEAKTLCNLREIINITVTMKWGLVRSKLMVRSWESIGDRRVNALRRSCSKKHGFWKFKQQLLF